MMVRWYDGMSVMFQMSSNVKSSPTHENKSAYSNVDSVLQDFIVTWNYIYTGTPLALKKKVNESNFRSGLATRLTCIPLPSTNFEMLTREVSVDYESDERLKEWAYKLDRTKGELNLRKTIESFARLSEEFTAEDVMRCFSLHTIAAARTRANRFVKDGLAKKIDDSVKDGKRHATYKKTISLLF